MRIGINPEKKNRKLEIENYHRVIIPVYIPNFEGYFKDSFKILKLCIESLLLTIHDKTRITIYNNASNSTIKEYIDKLYESEQAIDQVFHSKENLGKINAILAASKGNLEPLITISDSDVFFKKSWQEKVENVFLDFPEAGMVSPVPASKSYKDFVDPNWYYAFFKGKMRFNDVLDPEGLANFDRSLGRDTPLYNDIHLKKYLTISNKKSEVVMGCGHFLATMRRKVFDKGTAQPAFIKIVGGVENKFIDLPNQKLGFLRLATKGNHAYHLGNIHEEWMEESMIKLQTESMNVNSFNISSFDNSRPLNRFQLFVGRVVRKFLLSKSIRNTYFRLIGLKNSKDY